MRFGFSVGAIALAVLGVGACVDDVSARPPESKPANVVLVTPAIPAVSLARDAG